MPLIDKVFPFGIRDVKLTPMNASETLGTAVDLPAARTLSFSETVESEELRGDDIVQASHENGPVIEWDLEEGGISLAAYAVMAGGTVTSSGTTPNQVRTYSKLGTDARGYFKAEGQAISDSGGDLHGIIYKAKADGNLEGSMEEGSFWITAASGKGYPNASNKLYDFVQNETAVAIS